MKNNRHLRDKKITIMQITTVQDEDGFNEEKLIPLPDGENIWAYYRHASANEFYAAHTTNIKVEAIFEIAYRDDIDTYCKIKYKNELYKITQIDDFEGYKKHLKIHACKVD